MRCCLLFISFILHKEIYPAKADVFVVRPMASHLPQFDPFDVECAKVDRYGIWGGGGGGGGDSGGGRGG